MTSCSLKFRLRIKQRIKYSNPTIRNIMTSNTKLLSDIKSTVKKVFVKRLAKKKELKRKKET